MIVANIADEVAISLNNVSKYFKRYERPTDRLKDMLFPSKNTGDIFWALKNINIDVSKGEMFGIIGKNGSGKSTLLQIIAGTLSASIGDVYVSGRIAALLELGSGFNPEFTGIQNVFFNGKILGLTEKEIENKFDDIAAFADIGSFIDQPVKTYSSGMFVRLAFSVAVNLEPEILIVDEALAVGDIAFQYKCMSKIKELKERGTTILFVSHDNSAVSFLCERSVWLSNGEILEIGYSRKVINKYIAYLAIPKKLDVLENHETSVNKETIEDVDFKRDNILGSIEVVQGIENADQRMGNQKCKLIGVGIFDDHGNRIKSFKVRQKLFLRISLRANEFIKKPLIGFNISDRLGNHIIETNTDCEGIYLQSLRENELLTVEFYFEIPNLRAGYYSLSVDVNNGDEQIHELCDWIVNALVCECINEEKVYGLVDIDIKISFSIEEFVAS